MYEEYLSKNCSNEEYTKFVEQFKTGSINNVDYLIEVSSDIPDKEYNLENKIVVTLHE